jgi:ribosomal-protein-serine acetyltransferase
VALKNGFELEGRLKQAEFLNGHYDDQNIYARIDDL